MRLQFVGTGEALDPQLPNTSLLLRGETTMLFDCGYAVPHAFWRLCADADALDGVWISHAHADHCFGLPALLLWMRLQGRSRPLTILGGPGSQARLHQVLELGYPGSFAAHKCYPIVFRELEPGATVRFESLRLAIAPSTHAPVNHAIRVEAPGCRPWAYSGDGAPTAATRALFDGVSLLVHECFFVDGPARKHAVLTQLLELAGTARVDTLALLHFATAEKPRLRARASAHDGPFAVALPAPGDALELALDSGG